jgi:hypothetical protein
MPDRPFVPEWIDRRTADWCADLCDAVAARTLRRLDGARIAANTIRNTMAAARPQLPAVVDPQGDG